eukprot:TRINITY_DN30404_c0_g2_i1.p1 TRINITY_DN30404_c0_g2~~TRINITY_DN30404_c0_g2_i1.p1  ORF type:complete len:854 (-),score=140.25 TRINITY_DN30404_c0_g2_i1:81-2567(-)
MATLDMAAGASARGATCYRRVYLAAVGRRIWTASAQKLALRPSGVQLRRSRAIVPLRCFSLLVLVAFGAAAAFADSEEEAELQAVLDTTPAEVVNAQRRWADGFVDIARLHKRGDPRYKNRAARLVDELYAYGGEHPVLFSTPEDSEAQFRPSSAGAKSYFVGGDPRFPEDRGFSLSGWTGARFENADVHLLGRQALSMGTCYLQDEIGNETQLHYTLGYIRDPSGRLRINLQHFSYPYVEQESAVKNVGITQEEIRTAQRMWADGVVEIGKYYAKGWHYHERTNMFVDTTYGYDVLPVTLFRPAQAERHPFRRTRDGAISYFIGGNDDFAEDSGFALRPWTSIEFENGALLLDGELAWAVGLRVCRAADGSTSRTQYVMGYVRDSSGALRLGLHHETVPTKGRAGSEGGYEMPSDVVGEAEVERAQSAWGQAFMAIGAERSIGGDYLGRAARLVDGLYAYGSHPVFFKPAEAREDPFRSTREGAISYFVGGNRRFAEDRGVALQPWRAVRFANEAMELRGREALVIGNMFLTGPQGVQSKSTYTLGYVADDAGLLRLNLHHASFPVKVKRRRGFVPVTRRDIEAAQRRWGAGIVEMGDLAGNRTLCSRRARRFVDDLYGFVSRPSVFHATDTSEGHFRYTREGVISYLVGSSLEFPGDYGLVNEVWKQVKFDNAGGISLSGNRGQAMGNAVLTNAQGASANLEYTMSYFRDDEGKLRLDQHFLAWPTGTPDFFDAGSLVSPWMSRAASRAASGMAGGTVAAGALAVVAAGGLGFAALTGWGQMPKGVFPRGMSVPQGEQQGLVGYGYAGGPAGYSPEAYQGEADYYS